MSDRTNITLVIEPGADLETTQRLQEKFAGEETDSDLTLKLDGNGLSLHSDGQMLKGDFTRMLHRLKGGLSKELLVRAAKIKGAEEPLTVLDATAGLGEDSFLLAAAGFRVTLYERNPVIYELLRDALRRAAQEPELAEIMGRMELICADSIKAMKSLKTAPDVILLDPMFPERQKSALVKKKLQMIQKLEIPCTDETELMMSAMSAGPKRLVIKRPPKGPYLAELKPDYSIQGKAVRFDCIASPADKVGKLRLAGK